jgi:hypothetical protein
LTVVNHWMADKRAPFLAKNGGCKELHVLTSCLQQHREQ